MKYLQINRYAKKMNGPTVYPDRLCWTTLALNQALPLHRALFDMRFSENQSSNGYLKGVLPDSHLICNHICQKLGYKKKDLLKKVDFDANFWVIGGEKLNPNFHPSVASKITPLDFQKWYKSHEKYLEGDFRVNSDDESEVMEDDTESDLDGCDSLDFS
jgi:hypothetical protein